MLRVYILILITALLVSCSSTFQVQDLQRGRTNFTSGNYKMAFHQLLPLAANGDAEAQYAVGYMYYYGYGVSQDTESGIFWMQKSANQHYPPAIKALAMITCPTNGCQTKIQ